MAARISLVPVIYERYKYKDGTYPIKIRVTFNRKSTYITTNFVATKQQLTKSLNFRDAGLENQVLDYINRLRTKLNKLQPEDLLGMNINNVITYLLKNDNPEKFTLDFYEYGEEIASRHISTSARNYRQAISALRRFTKKKNLDIAEVTSALMRNFEAYLIKTYGKEARCVSLYTGHIRTIHLQAQKEFNSEEIGDIKIKNPFAYYKPPKPPLSKHRNLDKNIIQKMINDCRSLEGAEQIAVEVFLLSFCLMGINFPDLYELEPEHDMILRYERHKTRDNRRDKAETYAKIPTCILPLYDKWSDPSRKQCFAFYKRYSSFRNFQVLIGRGLRLYRQRNNLSDNLTFYAARHSWATLMNEDDRPLSVINDGLSHVDPNMVMTSIYVKKSWDKVFKHNEEFLNKNFDWTPLK